MKSSDEKMFAISRLLGNSVPYLTDALLTGVPELAALEWAKGIRWDDSEGKTVELPLYLEWKHYFVSIVLRESDMQGKGEEEIARNMQEEIRLVLVDFMGQAFHGGDSNGMEWDGARVGIDNGDQFPEYGGISRKERDLFRSPVLTLPHGPLFLLLREVWGDGEKDRIAILPQRDFGALWMSAPATVRYQRGNSGHPFSRMGFDVVVVEKTTCLPSPYAREDIIAWELDAVRMYVTRRENGEMMEWGAFRITKEHQEGALGGELVLQGQLTLVGNFYFDSSRCMRINCPKALAL